VLVEHALRGGDADVGHEHLQAGSEQREVVVDLHLHELGWIGAVRGIDPHTVGTHREWIAAAGGREGKADQALRRLGDNRIAAAEVPAPGG
jgi:hypothetical protein